ncbi:MAG: hypothetical protein RLZZ292_3759 [Bacteroidota bacterium]|jgi:hypothetical protein
MGYSNFKKISQVRDKLGIRFAAVDMFKNADIIAVEPSEWLNISLKRAYTTPPTNEKSKSERIVSPILLEVVEQYAGEIAFFSGEEININSSEDLSGPCDFFFALTPPSLLMEAPIISLVEAKDEDLDYGIAQCAAQLYAANLFNLQDGKKIDILYGCATTGTDWQFLKYDTLTNTCYTDIRPLTELPKVLGILHWIIQFFIKKHSTPML